MSDPYRPSGMIDDKPTGHQKAVLRYLEQVAYPAMIAAGCEPREAMRIASLGVIDRVNHLYSEQARRVLARRVAK